MTRIFKFGGASVKDAAAIRNLSFIVSQERAGRLVIVVSAMGKTTAELEQLAYSAYKSAAYTSQLDLIRSFHHTVAQELIGEAGFLDSFFEGLDRELETKDRDWYQYLDTIVSFGELLSTSIVARFLQDTTWLDARELITTSRDFGEGKILWDETRKKVKKAVRTAPGRWIVTQGYIGRSMEGETTTLGKEGSDFTAAVLSNILDAECMVVWKDVPGIMNADPKIMSDAQLFKELSYQEITEMTYYGAKVIHSKTIQPLAQKKIPLLVKSFLSPTEEGTSIGGSEDLRVSLPTFILKFSQLVVTLRVRDNSFMDENQLVKIFEQLKKNNIKINLMQSSALTFTFCFDYHAEKIKNIRKALQELFFFTYNEDLQLATVKNYSEESLKLLPPYGEIIIEQRSRSVYHRLAKP